MMSAASALKKQQIRLDTIANNVANVNTTGFKNSRVDFKDSFYANGITPGPARNPEANQQKGHGLMLAGIGTDFTGGIIQVTGIPLDFALEGEGFFVLGDLNGNVFYTRNGNFTLSAEADGNYLVNAGGLYVLDTNGERIRVPVGATRIEVGTGGEMIFTSPTEVTTANLGIFTFRNITGLHSIGNSLFTESDSTGERLVPENTVVRQGALEGSNVNLADEITRMMRTQRAFQLASRALTTADDMEGVANNMRR